MVKVWIKTKKDWMCVYIFGLTGSKAKHFEDISNVLLLSRSSLVIKTDAGWKSPVSIDTKAIAISQLCK